MSCLVFQNFNKDHTSTGKLSNQIITVVIQRKKITKEKITVVSRSHFEEKMEALGVNLNFTG